MLNESRTHGLWERTAPPFPSRAVLREDATADVVVIGAGYTGLSAALHLVATGASVIVLEAAEVGFGGSGRNVGLVNAGMWIPPELVVARLGDVFGNRLVQLLGDAPRGVFDLIEEHGIECEATRAGTLHCAVGRKGVKNLEERADQWRSRGAPVRILDAQEAARRVGSPYFHCALLDDRAGTIQPLAYVRGLALAASSRGARVFVRSPALQADRSFGRWLVRTPHGTTRSDWIVVATNAYATGPWQVVREEQIHLPYFNFATRPLEPDIRASILPGREGGWDTRQVLSSFRCDAAGRVIFGSIGTLHGRSARLHEEWARRALQQVFPQLHGVMFEAGWYGQIGMTEDNLPRFHVFAPNVIGFSGYNGRGIAPGTAFGRVLSDYIAGRLAMNDLPLPATAPHIPVYRSLREAGYRMGAAALHFIRARI